MVSAASYIFESFAGHAPPEARLLVKAHPLECGFFNWPGFIRREAKRLGLQGRLFYVDGGDLERLAENAQGMVCVNSTSGTLALIVDTPVCVLGDAIYDMPGITHQGHLDTFWKTPTPPDPKAYDAFPRTMCPAGANDNRESGKRPTMCGNNMRKNPGFGVGSWR